MVIQSNTTGVIKKKGNLDTDMYPKPGPYEDEGRGRGAEDIPYSLSLSFAAEFTAPPQKPPRLGAQVCSGSAEAGNGLESGPHKTQGLDCKDCRGPPKESSPVSSLYS